MFSFTFSSSRNIVIFLPPIQSEVRNIDQRFLLTKTDEKPGKTTGVQRSMTLTSVYTCIYKARKMQRPRFQLLLSDNGQDMHCQKSNCWLASS